MTTRLRHRLLTLRYGSNPLERQTELRHPEGQIILLWRDSHWKILSPLLQPTPSNCKNKMETTASQITFSSSSLRQYLQTKGWSSCNYGWSGQSQSWGQGGNLWSTKSWYSSTAQPLGKSRHFYWLIWAKDCPESEPVEHREQWGLQPKGVRVNNPLFWWAGGCFCRLLTVREDRPGPGGGWANTNRNTHTHTWWYRNANDSENYSSWERSNY